MARDTLGHLRYNAPKKKKRLPLMSLNNHPSTRFNRSVYDSCGPLRDAFDLSCFSSDLNLPLI